MKYKDRKPFTVRIEPEAIEKIKKCKKETGRSQCAIIENLINNFIKKLK